VLRAPDPLSAASLHVMIDEDQLSDAERVHTSERVSFLVLESR
jgi:hypothetical protein